MRTYWGSDGKFKGYSQNFNPAFGITYVLGMVLAGAAIYFFPILCAIIGVIYLLLKNWLWALLWLIASPITFLIWHYTIWK